MLFLKIPVEPMGAVRMTRRGKFTSKSAHKYLSYKNTIKWHVLKQVKHREPLEGPLSVDVLFCMPIPKSWSKKKQRESVGGYHMKKPDADNLIKGVFDSLNKIVWQDDNQVAKMSAMKLYAEIPMIEIRVEEIA